MHGPNCMIQLGQKPQLAQWLAQSLLGNGPALTMTTALGRAGWLAGCMAGWLASVWAVLELRWTCHVHTP